MLMIQLCDALQEGKPFLGMATAQQNCLYLQADAGLVEWKQQVSQLAGNSMAWTIHQVDKGFLDKPETVQYFHDIVWAQYATDDPIAALLQHRPFTFVVVDCLNAVTNGDIDTKLSASKVLKALETICTHTIGGEKQQVHYLLVHHPNKSVHKGVQAGSGSAIFAGECSTKLTLTGRLLVLEKARLCKGKEIELKRLDNGAWALLGDSVSDDTNLDISQMLGLTLRNGSI